MKELVFTVNVLAWPVIQIGVARWMLRRPEEDFCGESWLTRLRAWERRCHVYRRVLLVPRWKKYLPDGGAWLGGPPKKRLAGRKHVDALLCETRRGELAHWYMLACTPVLFLWNPPWACAVMLGYGLAANVPCIVAQRYNRARIRSAQV